MKHYDFPDQFRKHYDKALKRYSEGARSAPELYDKSEAAWLAANGITPQHMFDYVEDDSNYGEPGFAQALSIEMIRRNYFINIQNGRPSTQTLDQAGMPAKTDAVEGIAWLPRLIPKAKAKLRGELPPSLMYCCGGDRKFFQEHDIIPSEFLGLVWRCENDDKAVVDWVVKRSKS